MSGNRGGVEGDLHWLEVTRPHKRGNSWPTGITRDDIDTAGIADRFKKT